MRSFGPRPAIVILALAASTLLCSCHDDGPDLNADCIGPAGGSVAVTDPSDGLYGVSFAVDPGDWQDCWTVRLSKRSSFATPNFPDGIEGYDDWLTGGVDLAIGRYEGDGWVAAPDSLDFELTFPLRGLTADPGWKIMAFRFDDEAGIYRLVVPTRVDADRFTVKGHDHGQIWTWGKVDLGAVDFATYLAPVMAELHGEAGWLEIKAELTTLANQIVSGHQIVDCNALQAVRGLLQIAATDAAENVRAMQAAHGECGTCDVTSQEFYDELGEYLKQVMAGLLSQLLTEDSGSVFVRLYGYFITGYMAHGTAQAGCDFACLADAVHLDFYSQLATYAVCRLVLGVIDYAFISGYVRC